MAFRLLKSMVVAGALAGAWHLLPAKMIVVRADGGSCSGTAHADAASYDGSLSGSADNSFSADTGSIDDCDNAGQGNATSVAGAACANASVPSGGGNGYASVTWSVMWTDPDTGEQVPGESIGQQYDCGDVSS